VSNAIFWCRHEKTELVASLGKLLVRLPVSRVLIIFGSTESITIKLRIVTRNGSAKTVVIHGLFELVLVAAVACRLTVLIILLLPLSLSRKVTGSIVLDAACSASIELNGSLKWFWCKNKSKE
jgi:phosphate/sulfate permease